MSRLDEIRERFAKTPSCTCDSHYLLQRLGEAEAMLKEIAAPCLDRNGVEILGEWAVKEKKALALAYFEKWK